MNELEGGSKNIMITPGQVLKPCMHAPMSVVALPEHASIVQQLTFTNQTVWHKGHWSGIKSIYLESSAASCSEHERLIPSLVPIAALGHNWWCQSQCWA